MTLPTSPPHVEDGAPRAGPGLLQAPEHVLATLERDGRRRWLRPRLSPGRFLTARRAVAWVLMLIFVVLPHLRIGGRPPILLDIGAREFTLLGVVFGPTETPYLMLLMLSVFIGVFLLTALLGRAWCGWACPQTVYLEHLFRPIERLLEGSPQEQRLLDEGGPSGRRALKLAVFAGIAFVLGNTFLAYFVGTDRLAHWMRSSPAEHPGAFVVMAVTTALVLFDFGWFREQTCLVACPYGRFQSVLLDRHSLIVGYDKARGEPRGKPGRKGALPLPTAPVATAAPLGDCVACSACVATCPTGIDIRDGLQMECVGCAQCIDACYSIMDKLGRPRGLIRYASQAELATPAEPTRIVRPRVLAYAAVLLGLVVALGLLLQGRASSDAVLLRPTDRPFVELASGEVQTQVRVKVQNRGAAAREYRLAIDTPGVTLVTARNPLTVGAGESAEVVLFVLGPAERWTAGALHGVLTVDDGREFRAELPVTLLGPAAGGKAHDEGHQVRPEDRHEDHHDDRHEGGAR